MTTILPIEGSAAELKARLAGQVVTRGDAEFAELCKAWNLAFTHHPSLIVIPSSASDVSAAVRHAADHGMRVTIQATGHGVARTAEGGMLLLTRDLDQVTIDASAWTARLGSGAKWEKVLGPATEAGLAPLLGSTPDVSAVGYTLGGGMGWIARKFGLSADHVRSIEIVTADGQILRTDPDNNPDLFWALRGGGAGSLGVVTAMEIDLVSVQSLYAGNLFYPTDVVRQVGARYRDWIKDAPDELTSAICLMNFPPMEDVPEPIRGRSFVIVRGAYIGDDSEGEQLLSYWRDWEEPELDMWGRIPFSEVATISNDPVDPLIAFGTTEWLESVSDEVIDILAKALFETDGPSPLMMAEIRHAGGAVARRPADHNSYSNRSNQHLLEIVGVAPDPAAVAAMLGYASAVQKELAPHTSPGVYLNFLEGEEKTRRTAEAFEPEKWDKLRQIKQRYDPNNLFANGVVLS